jgi:hypothetical protein
MEYTAIIKRILINNDNYIAFQESLTVKSSPHNYPEKVIAILFSLDGNLLYEIKQNNELKFLDEASEIVQASILQRLKLMQYKKQIK